MARRAIFVTGGAGFVGRRLLQALGAAGLPVIALDRSGALSGSAAAGVTVVKGDVLAPETYRDALQSCDAALHLAAATGRASAEEHFRVNARGADVLLEECRRAGISRFLFVSSIATTFPSLRGYHYAQAKLEAEAAVRGSGLRFAILRPTIILGPGAPILGALEKLARLPVVVLPGAGRARVQPIHVDDVARAIVAVVRDDLFTNETFEIGGPDTVTMEELVRRLRMARLGRDGRVVHVPLWVVRPPLRLAEAAGIGRLLPMTAGQLSSFEWDGVAAPNPLQDRIASGLMTLSQMVSAGGEQAGEPASALDAECRVFTRHLVGADANAYVKRRYAIAHDTVPALAAATPFERALVSFARRGALFALVADAYAAVLAPRSTLRKKLVLLLAILETCPPSHATIDRTIGRSVPGVVARMALRGVVGIVACLAGVVLLSPVRVALSLRRAEER